MSKASRDKGARGEREVAAIFKALGFDTVRTPNSGGLHVKGDVLGVAGFHLECKRQEVLRIPAWVRQSHAESGDAVPVVAYRQSHSRWYAILPLDDLARLIQAAAMHAGSDPEVTEAARETGA